MGGGGATRYLWGLTDCQEAFGWGRSRGDIFGVSLTVRKLMGGGGARRYLWGLTDCQEAYGWGRSKEISLGSH